jgi:hypothetical protein
VFNLFVGDVFEELAAEAKNFDPTAYLLTFENIDSFINNPIGATAYTSVADIGSLGELHKVCCKADKIFYRPPVAWSDETKDHVSKQREYLHTILLFHAQSGKVDNVSKLTTPYDFLAADFLQDQRVANKQFWAVGCSISHGVGVTQPQTWKHLVSKKLNLPYSNLTSSGSSIIWQSDQILRSDLRPGDIVFWGITTQNRMPVVAADKTILHLHHSKYKDIPKLNDAFPIDLIDNPTLYWQNVLAVRRASNFCQKVGAKLVAVGLVFDSLSIYKHYNIPEFFQLQYQHGFLDLGRDNIHPGPLQHQRYADTFLEFYSKLYNPGLVANN